MGNTARFCLDLGADCHRICHGQDGTACEHSKSSHGQVKSKSLCVCNSKNPRGQFLRKKWHEEQCPTCQEFELQSGDILLFKGTKSADIAHGAVDTLSGSGPEWAQNEEWAKWARGCRVSLQYRVSLRPPGVETAAFGGDGSSFVVGRDSWRKNMWSG